MLAEILGIMNLAVVMFCLGIVGGWFLRKTLAPGPLPTQFSSVFTYPNGDCIHFKNHAKNAADKAY